jgi:hypothetical protein
MVRISRYILILTGVIVISIAFPMLYWMIFEKVPVSPNVFYSCILNDFLVNGSEKAGPGKYVDSKGKIYTTAEYEKNMPLMFFRQLMTDGKMPDSIKGVSMEPVVINKANSFFRYTPKKLYTPAPSLYPMFESKSGRVNLEMPLDFFRINKRMEFIVAKTNKIDEVKSELFTNALKEKGFSFPAKIIAGIPTTRKSKDDGYFVTDVNEKLFQIKMVKGNPLVTRIETPEDLGIVYIECVDLRNSEFYCYIFTKSNGIYVVLDGEFELQRLPVENFDPASQSARINCDLFNKCITISGDNWLKATAIDDMYMPVNSYEEKWKEKYELKEGKIISALVPFELSFTSQASSYVNLFFKFSDGFVWIITNLLITGLALFIFIRLKKNIKDILPDLLIVLVTGIYGLILVFAYPNKFYKVPKTNKQ